MNRILAEGLSAALVTSNLSPLLAPAPAGQRWRPFLRASRSRAPSFLGDLTHVPCRSRPRHRAPARQHGQDQPRRRIDDHFRSAGEKTSPPATMSSFTSAMRCPRSIRTKRDGPSTCSMRRAACRSPPEAHDEVRRRISRRRLRHATSPPPLPPRCAPIAPMPSWSFCGGHTHAISRYGIEDLLPKNVRMIHGPGCPVCVLPIRPYRRCHPPGETSGSHGSALMPT